MHEEINANFGRQSCPEFESQIMLFALDELEGAERDSLEEHLDGCSRCVAALNTERKMLEILASQQRPDPSPALLSSCRNRLEDSLDEMDHRSVFARWAESIFPAHWLALHPAASVAVLLLIGFSVGTLAPWRSQVGTSSPSRPPATLGSMAMDNQELQTAAVSGINWTPTSDNRPPLVEVQMTTEKPVVVQGTVDDKEVKQVLLYVLHNNRRFGPDVRINAVELLRARANDPDVQKALCQAVRIDRNAAVRLKALEALTDAQPNQEVVQTMLDALVKDANIGVRVEAINSLRAFSARGALLSDPQAFTVLRDRMRTDPNNYIRLQSAAAIQQTPSGRK
ncbi:MAG TPA: HEAT repeat domain-containing protein [Candidatus Acidoferrales bacterium]|nr:HEAT repeat domain-containing protein [Candidatus Acidoferrales bacterium]